MVQIFHYLIHVIRMKSPSKKLAISLHKYRRASSHLGNEKLESLVQYEIGSILSSEKPLPMRKITGLEYVHYAKIVLHPKESSVLAAKLGGLG